jgi:hypothetical protein
MSTIVSILSDQPIPVVLFIKQMGGPADEHIFLSTVEMEAGNKSGTIAGALGLAPQQYQIVEIDANSPALILDVLDNYVWPEQEQYIVNITGGTKMMSQMTYIHFSEKKNTRIYYWPIGSNRIELLHPVIEELEIENPFALDLTTYLKAHGYEFSAQKKLSAPFAKAQSIFNRAIQAGSAGALPEIKMAKEETYLGADKSYLTGGWFEEWLFAFLKNKLHLSDGYIAYNLKLKNHQSVRNSEADNEVDVAFVYKNRLYLWECKVSKHGYQTGKQIAVPIYKISSVSQSLGLQATSFVVIFSKFGKSAGRDAFLTDITRLMRIKQVFGMEDLKDQEAFISTIKKLIGYGT